MGVRRDETIPAVLVSRHRVFRIVQNETHFARRRRPERKANSFGCHLSTERHRVNSPHRISKARGYLRTDLCGQGSGEFRKQPRLRHASQRLPFDNKLRLQSGLEWGWIRDSRK
jgi:hypothetical protein